MSGQKFTFEEIVRSMTDLGIPREQAERQARHECGLPESVVDFVQVVGEPLAFPVRLTLPWSALCSDNDKYGAAIMRNGATTFPRLVLTPAYRAARKKVKEVARGAMRGCPALAQPLALHARVFLPDGRVHDVCNFSKCAHDALEDIVYANDSWLHRVVWERAGVDVDHPRAELTVSPL